MIYLESEKSNCLFVRDYQDFQSYYNACLKSWDLRAVTCSHCDGTVPMWKNGSYRRRLQTANGMESVKVQRMRCPRCGHSDALFPADIVAYSPVMTEDHVAIIEIYLDSPSEGSFAQRISAVTEECEECMILPSVPDIPAIAKLIRRFETVWADISSSLIPLFSSLYSLVKFCIGQKRCCFQQPRGKARYIHTGVLAGILST